MKPLLPVVILLLASCTGKIIVTSPPTAEMAERVTAFAHDASGGKITLSGFAKTDGLTEADGTYVADYTAEITFTECGTWKPGGDFAHRTPHTRMMSFRLNGPFERCAEPGTRENFNETLIAYPVGAGYTMRGSGQALFVKKENGWKLTDAWVNVKAGE